MLCNSGVFSSVLLSHTIVLLLSAESDPEKTKQPDGSFTPTVTEDETFLHTYNCNTEPFPRENDLSHRRKQVRGYCFRSCSTFLKLALFMPLLMLSPIWNRCIVRTMSNSIMCTTPRSPSLVK